MAVHQLQCPGPTGVKGWRLKVARRVGIVEVLQVEGKYKQQFGECALFHIRYKFGKII